ncbi:MAG TPA: hypothetical protein VH814_21600 [Steroidobacteraceae bacterium]
MTPRDYKLFLTRLQKFTLVFPAIMLTAFPIIFLFAFNSSLSIEPRHHNTQAALSGYLLRHSDGKIRFPGQFTDQYLLRYELKQEKPDVELKGC